MHTLSRRKMIARNDQVEENAKIGESLREDDGY